MALYCVYRSASGDHFYTTNSAERDFMLGANSSALNPITPLGTAHIAGIRLGTANIDGSSYTVLE